MKKIWEKPNIRFGLEPGGDAEETGGGTGQSGQAAYPCSYADWGVMFFVDLDNDGDFDEDDYRLWWDEMGFTEDDWYIFNEDVPFNP